MNLDEKMHLHEQMHLDDTDTVHPRVFTNFPFMWLCDGGWVR